MPINLLETSLINQIAAGEVIERPKSVLKELLENSLDAHATQITVEVENGGLSSILVRDNGVGMTQEELPLAICQHATSKITCFEDLYRLQSLGFRGEALASISAVSKLTLTTKTIDAQVGTQLTCNGQIQEYTLQPIAHPVGTSITVNELFFNLPARQKFLKKASTEYTHLVDLLGKIILSRPDVEFTFKHNDRLIWQFAPALNAQDQLHRIDKIIDAHFSEHALKVDTTIENYTLKGWITDLTYTKNQNDYQYFYLNNRSIKDKNLTHAVKLAYQDLLPSQNFPLAILFWEVDPQLVDVNVHPTKTEVRFVNPHALHNFTVSALKKALQNRHQPTQSYTSPINQPLANSPQHFKKLLPLAPQKLATNHIELRETPLLFEVPLATPETTLFPLPTSTSETETLVNNRKVVNDLPPSLYLGKAIGQIQNMFLLAENEQGLIIVDIHAACERITYEQLKKELATHQQLIAQKLLVPVTCELTLKELALLERHATTLQNLGLDWRQSSHNRIILVSIPTLIKKPASELTLLKDLLYDLAQFGNSDSYDLQIKKLLTTFACHHSIRSGQSLSLVELDSLLRDIEHTLNGDRCGHGRPTWIQLTKQELAKLFLRT